MTRQKVLAIVGIVSSIVVGVTLLVIAQSRQPKPCNHGASSIHATLKHGKFVQSKPVTTGC